MLVPGRKGISPSATDLFLTQDLDPNIQSGLVWTRSPQVRAVYRPSQRVALGISVETDQTYGGGSAGSGAIKVPSAFAPDYFNQVDLGNGGVTVPNPHLDLIGKLAFDVGTSARPVHIEVAGLLNQFLLYNPNTGQRYSAQGGGGSVNAAIDVAKGLTALTANYYSDGGGRFIFGEAPALIIKGDGSPSLVHAMSTLDGLEYQANRNLKLWAYYGGTYIDRNVAIDPTGGGLVGYGYTGSPDNHNRSIQEVTAGLTRVFGIKPPLGTLQVIGQYSGIIRHPWYVAPGHPGAANLQMVYLTFRYVLPPATTASKK
jgi:hypothetical protein